METSDRTNEIISLPYSASMDGIVFRRFRGEADYANILAIINSCNETDQLDRADTLEDVTRNYSHLHHCDPYRDMLFAEAAGKAVASCRCWWEQESGGPWLGFHLAFVNPKWRAKGIGTTMLTFMEERLKEIHRELVQQGEILAATPAYYSSMEILESEAAQVAFLEKNDYRPVRYELHMTRPDLEDIPEAPMPQGLEVRPALPEHRRQIWDAAQEAFQDHWGFVPPNEEDYQNWLEDANINLSLYKVAWDGDQIAGMVQNFIIAVENEKYQRKRGYTEGICVRRPWRKRGLAHALIALSLQELKKQGMAEAALSVDSLNWSGALHLYESKGYRMVRRAILFRKPLEPGI